MLAQNYPNPLTQLPNPVSSIQHLVIVTLKIYDILGNEIVTLVNEEKPTGIYEVEFSAEGLSSGMYLYKLQAINFSETKKMILVK